MSEQRFFNGRQRKALYLASGGVCEGCGMELEPGWHADHEKPWSKGGLTDVINGQALCPTCNLKKGVHMNDKKPLRKWQREALELYDQHQEKAFLVEACPAAGKSRFIAEVVQRELHKGKADAIVVVVPSAALRTQMALDFHEETGIQLDPAWNGMGVPLMHGGFKGVVVTYQWLSNNSSLMRMKVVRQSTLVVLDEVHHAQDERAWGAALREAFEPATKILLTTGTPFTTNGNPISFVNYDAATGLAISDYSYNYGKALSEPEENVVRAIIFNHHQGEMVWDSEDGIRKATFDEKLNKQDISRRLRTAIHEDKEHVGALLQQGIYKLRELREDDSDAAMLVVARDQEHARKLAKRMQQEFGITPIVVVSQDGDAAAGKIKAFKNSNEPCIIAVDMISEGVNIPRIRVIVYATNVTTLLYFTQVLGRAMRIQPGHDDHTAYVFTPDDERFRFFSAQIMKECEEALAKRDEKHASPDREEPDQDSFLFNPLSASFTNVIATFNGIPINANELAVAATLKTSNPSLRGMDRSQIIVVMKAIGFDPITATQPETQDSPKLPEESHQTEKPLHEKLSDLRQENNKIVKRLYYSKKGTIEFANINFRLNTTIGIRKVERCFDPDKLQRRYDLAKRWLTKGIEPEVSFND